MAWDLLNRSLMANRKRVLLLAIIALIALPTRIKSHDTGPSPTPAAGAATAATDCVAHYNALLAQAERALSHGDRGAAIDLLKRARTVAGSCAGVDGAAPAFLASVGTEAATRFDAIL